MTIWEITYFMGIGLWTSSIIGLIREKDQTDTVTAAQLMKSILIVVVILVPMAFGLKYLFPDRDDMYKAGTVVELMLFALIQYLIYRTRAKNKKG